MSGLDLTLDPERQPRRFEVINGAGGRRRWSIDEKARIVAETLEPNVVISEVARRHGLRPQQVFTWRREARKSDVLTRIVNPPPQQPDRRSPALGLHSAVSAHLIAFCTA